MSSINPHKPSSLPPDPSERERKSRTSLNSSTRTYKWISSSLSACMRLISGLWNRFLSFLYNALSLIRPGTGLGSRDVVHQKEENTHNEFVTAVALDALAHTPALTPAAASSEPTASIPKTPPHKPIPEDLSLTDVSSFYEVTTGHAYKDEWYKGSDMKPDAAMRAVVDSDSYMKKYNIETWLRDERLNTIAAPTDRGLLLLAAHYEHKYGIKMLVVTSEEGLREAVKGSSLPPSCQNWGIIYTQGQASGLGHVTPLLCHKTAEGSVEAAVLDSTGKSYFSWFTDYPDIKWSYAEKGRQSDERSCRTDALVILKDALTNLAKHPVPTLDAFFDMKDVPSRKEKSFLLPSLLGRTAQISSAIQHDGTKKMATKYGESLSEFKKRHSAKVKVEKRVTVEAWNTKENYAPLYTLPKEVVERDMNLF